jgi:hypothetical protein
MEGIGGSKGGGCPFPGKRGKKIYRRDTEDTEIHRERESFIFGASSVKNKKIL